MTLSIIPLPQKVTVTGGVFCVSAETQIFSDQAARPEAEYLAGQLQAMLGSAVSVSSETSAFPSITLQIDPALEMLGSEGYLLSVTEASITIRAARQAGLFYGVQTLLQMLDGEGAVPCAEIEDKPRFGWRGAMLDVSRHFMPKEFVFQFIDLLALHKMNILQLHLTDDQGWRIEIKKYPRLTSVGGMRQETMVGRALANPADADFDPASQKFDGVPYGGFYTQEDAREIVAYAALRHVTVVPEIEMPGHAQSAIAAYPFLGCTDETVEVSPRWGIHEALYKPAEPTFEFLRDVLTEIIEIFPSPYLHIGGDEAVKVQWISSPECQAIQRNLGLHDAEAMQSYFVGRINKLISQRGRTLVGWDEILEGGLTPGSVVMSWRGEAGGVAAALEGHDVVMAPAEYTYFNFYQSDAAAEPLAFHELLTLDTVYGYEPVPAALPREQEAHVLGAQCQFWTEYMPSEKQVEYMAFPRISAFSEVAWTDRQHKDYSSFLRRLPKLLTRLDALDVNYRPLTSQK